MKTFEQFEQGISTVPISATWYLADLGEALGKQTLFVNQSPQKLKVLRDMREQGACRSGIYRPECVLAETR